MGKLRKRLPPLSSLLPFEATARLGSITKAGVELGLTQAAISKQVRVLEENLGAPLFERRNRALYLTAQGREFSNTVTVALASIGNDAQALRQKHTEGEVVLHAQLCEGLYWVMPRLSRFYQQHPNIEVRVSVSTDPITEAQERFDLAIQTSHRESGNAIAVYTVSDDVFPICSPTYLKDQNLSIDQLSQYRLLHHKVTPQDWIDWDSWLAQLDLDLRVGSKGEVYDSYPMMMQAVLEGHGIALGWRHTTEQLLTAGTLVKPFKESLHLPNNLSVYQPAGWPMRENTVILLDWLKGQFS